MADEGLLLALALVGQAVDVGQLAILVDERVEREVAPVEPDVHLLDLRLLDVEGLGDLAELGVLRRHALQLLLGLVELEEELALVLGRPDLHEAPGLDDEVLHVGPDPPHGVGDEPVALVGVELLHRVHEPHVAFLDQVEELHPVVAVLVRDLDHEAKVGHDEFLCRFHVVVLLVADGQFEFLLRGQDGEPVDLGDI